MQTIRRLFDRRVLAASVIAAGFAAGQDAGALTLMQAYQAALQSDPQYRTALAENAQGVEYRNLGRAGLLPQVSASYSRSKNWADLIQHQRGVELPSEPRYISGTVALQLRQPLFNMDAWARWKQGQAQSNASAATFSVRAQELVLRVVQAYTDALFATEQLRLATAQRDALAEQRKVNDRLFEKGEGTRTDMLETQARLDAAEAAVLEAEDNLATARATLAGIVGQEPGELDMLAPNFRIVPLGEGGFDTWKSVALANNPALLTRTFNVEVAHQEVNKAKAGHAPRLDVVATLNKANAETLNTYTQESTSRVLGVQLTVPLYQGGYVNASTRQAVAGEERAKSELDAERDRILVELRKQYSAVVSGVTRIRALEKAVESGKLLMTATEQSIKGGVRINLDLLNARQQLFASERDLAQARYNYLLALLRLRAAAGMLGPDDVREIALYFR
ncbi:TolC family outer membrane protein [Massilia sp. METH4]|uniref:TolC family outer membrane protein n=1 Tax=Massilia sp. METH4 TaxID=3123041 RepID=UPI0030CF8008